MTASKLKKTLIAGLCVTAFSSGIVFANTQGYEILPGGKSSKLDYMAAYENKYSESKDIRLLINSQWVEADVAPFLENNRTLVPVRGVMEKLGASVEWDPEKKAVSITSDSISLQLVIGEKTVKITKSLGGETLKELAELDVAPKLVNGRTFVPVRFIAEAIGAKVNWDAANNVVSIEKADDDLIIGIERPLDFEILEPGSLEGKELVKWYDANSKNEGINIFAFGEWQYVLVSAGEKPTGGYEMRVDSLTQMSEDTVYVYAQLIAPAKDAVVTQALTYPNALLRFKRSGEVKIIGDISQVDPSEVIRGEIRPSLAEMGKAIDIDAIREMKLYSLMQKELKDFSIEESRDLVSKLNTSPTYDGPILMMLAGNSITIRLDGENYIQLTSYGNEEHVVVGGHIDGENFGYCVVNSEIGKLLLEKQ
jgi:hypothetical protein